MNRTRPVRLTLLLALGLAGGCAYFNALYNARRLYADAEAAANRGEPSTAEAAHRESLEKAARSLEQDPDGRWSDDALLLIGRNHFALGDCRAASAALRRLLRETSDEDLSVQARAWLGASLVCMQEWRAGEELLDQAIHGLPSGSASAAFAHLWRARARFEEGRDSAAWHDLANATARQDALGRAAALEQAVRAIERDRPDLAIAATHRLLADPAGDLHSDSVRVLVERMGGRWGGARAREALQPAAEAPWQGDIRDRLVIERARHAAAAGDTALALQELETAAARSALGPANHARLVTARLRLAGITDPAELQQVRRILLPAIAEQSARPLINEIGVVGTLLERARAGQPLALFAAAEVARDGLGAHALARRLFVGYAEVAGGTGWSTKALLAALELDPPPDVERDLRQRLGEADDLYALAARGLAPAGYEDSERRLQQVLTSLVSQARQEAGRRDVSVGEAIAELDSITAAAVADSLGLACGSLVDSLGLGGIRRDSVNAACMREDVALIDSFLSVDTAVLSGQRAIDTDEIPRPAGDTAARSANE